MMGVSGTAYAQVTAGSINGVVVDSSSAIVPDAAVILKDQATNAERIAKTNGTGAFSFVALPTGRYNLTVTHGGFSAFTVSDISLDQGENRTVPQIVLKVGSESATISVSADNEIIPIDTGQIQTTLNNKLVTGLAIQGRNAGELIKVLPGLALNTGLGQTEFSSLTTGTTSGPAGSFSANGTQPNGGLSETLDGANITDPGLQGAQVINVNQDQIEQVSILNSAFGAQYAKGPILFQAVSKSGTAQFHGGLYLYLRNGALNAEDAYFKSQDTGLPKPDDRQYYPGYTIGGPVVLPHLKFNRTNPKLFFFSGYEYNYQQPAGTLHELFVPTAQMLAGDFDPAYLSSLGLTGSSAGDVPCANASAGTYCATSGIVNGVIPPSQIDANALALAKLFPAPNQNPALHNGHNFAFNDNPKQNRFEIRERLDYNPSTKTQISGSYTKQNEGDLENFGIYYYPGATVPYPSQLAAHLTSELWVGNVTRTFGATATNNFILSYATHNFPLKPTNPEASDPATVGFTAQGTFKNNQAPQVPNLVSYSCYQSSISGCFPGLYAPTFTAGFNGGAFGNTVYTPAVADDFVKVIGRHTLQFGAYWDLQREIVTSGAAYAGVPQGQYEFENGGSNSTNNPNADFLLGHANSYSQVSAVPIQDIRYNQYSLYAQDQWKATRRLTLTYGLRLDHEGQWYPDNSPGFAVFDASKYSNSPTAPAFTGLVWHGTDSSVPISGWTSALFRPVPRLGVAYDLFGNGRTVLRGGYGIYLYQVSYNDVQAAYNPPLGVQSVFAQSLNSFASASTYAAAVSTGQNGNVTVLQRGDNQVPYTHSYNVTVTQHAPYNSVVEISYSGNNTRNALLTDTSTGTTASLANLNKIPVGALFQPDPVTGITYAPGQVPGSALQDYRPYANYEILNVSTHGSYSNYNAAVVTWQKQRGPVVYQLNYTWSKVLGIRDGQTDNGTNGNGTTTDAFNLAANYGTLGYDRPHVFNASYIFEVPDLTHRRWLGEFVNGLQFSGITQLQSGPPLQPNTGGNLGATYPAASTNQALLGTDSQYLRPLLTCDPRSKKYFNPNCFAAPTQIGQNGPAIEPDVRGPAFFNSDLGVYKSFALVDEQSIQFRLTGFNFLNHPLPQFGLGSDVNLSLNGPGGTNNNPVTTGVPQDKIGRRVVELAVKYVF